MSDDDDKVHGFGAHLVNRERRKQAAQQVAQQQAEQQQAAARQAAARKHDINRTAHFDGAIGYQRWLSAAWSLDGSQVAAGDTAALTARLRSQPVHAVVSSLPCWADCRPCWRAIDSCRVLQLPGDGGRPAWPSKAVTPESGVRNRTIRPGPGASPRSRQNPS